MKVYKVRHAETKLYRMAGVRTYWNKVGKTWDTPGKLRTMITCAINEDRTCNHDFGNREVIEYEVIEKQSRPVHEVVTANKLMELIKK
jgi:hypothetical protein